MTIHYMIDGVLHAMTDDEEAAFVAAQPSPPNLEDRRARVSADIDLHAKALRENVVALISPAEMSSWPIKQSQALAFIASNDEEDAPMLMAEAGYRQVTTAALVSMVLAKATQLAGVEAAISGECGRRQDLLRAADPVQIDVLAAGLRFGWPGFPDPPPISVIENP